MRHTFLPGLSVLALIALSISAQAANGNRYKWRDAGGNLHYSDSLPADASQYGYDIVNMQGLVVKHVERAKTAAELTQTKLAEAKAQAVRKQADALARADDQLLTGYPEESDLERAHKQSRDMLDQQLGAAQISLRSQEQALAELLDRAAEEERANRKVAPAQERQLAIVRKHVDEQRLLVEHREQARLEADAKFESETLRYRQLKAKASGQPTQ